ncbi:MAG: S8 family peptidase [Bacteroidia bacterium]|nr:S8 family peptidase [Bacteroidia bacterium]
MRVKCIVFFIALAAMCRAQSTGLNNALKLLLEEKNAPGFAADILVEGNIQKIINNQTNYPYTLNYYAGNIASIHCNIKTIPLLFQNKIIDYAEYLNANKTPLNDTAIYRNRLKGVKLWTAPLNQAYNGEGVLMGIIDTGTDFAHPDFKDSLGNTRIKFIWDQAKTTGSTKPQPFNYGIEWTHNQINNNQCTHTDVAYYGHGTHVSGIAAGNGRANGRNEGVASKSDMVVVALDFNRAGPTIADAVNYILGKATTLGKPCVINVSLGDYYGSHDGTDLEAGLIDNLIKNIPGRTLVAAAGNAGHVKFHVKTVVQNPDTLFTWMTGTGNLAYWCYADTQQIRQVKMSVGANRTNLSNIGRTGFKSFNYGLTGVKTDTLKNSTNKRIGLVKTSASINTKGIYELYLEIKPDSSNLLWRIETTGNGRHHAWNFDFVSTGLPTTTQYPPMVNYVMPDSMYTMVSSFQCSEEVITVANYCNLYSYKDVNNTLHLSGLNGGELAGTSSRGPTRDERIKPDVAATGHFVYSAMPLSLLSIYNNSQPTIVGQGGMHVLDGGTSSSSPMVAGLAALYLQAHPMATNAQVRDAVRYCAYSDAYTGSALPNYHWGFGKLDGKASMYCNEGVYNNLTNQVKTPAGKAFPNPFKQTLKINLEQTFTGKVEVFNAAGSLLFMDEINGKTYELSALALPANYQGLVFIRMSNSMQNMVFKVIKE